jgi:hypothetical protein
MGNGKNWELPLTRSPDELRLYEGNGSFQATQADSICATVFVAKNTRIMRLIVHADYLLVGQSHSLAKCERNDECGHLLHHVTFQSSAPVLMD